jgi:DNA modification methylase|nr:MAG TPA: adenine-specific methyltransferase [Caudoviricetes sp.]
MIELNKIYNEDCLEGMKKIPDGTAPPPLQPTLF